jgi:hypothetical protein
MLCPSDVVPRCQGLCGSQKYTLRSVATVKALCLAISSPRSHVSERRRVLEEFRGSTAISSSASGSVVVGVTVGPTVYLLPVNTVLLTAGCAPSGPWAPREMTELRCRT